MDEQLYVRVGWDEHCGRCHDEKKAVLGLEGSWFEMRVTCCHLVLYHGMGSTTKAGVGVGSGHTETMMGAE